MIRVFFKKLFILVLGFALTTLYMPRLSADENAVNDGDVIDMVSGDIQTVPVNSLTRVSVTNPEVADIADAQSDKVSLLAKKAGQTVLFLWDTTGKRSIKIRVVSEDLSAMKARIEKILTEANITGISLEVNSDIGKVVTSGDVSKEDKDRLGDILQPYSDNLLNLVKEEKSEDLIQVDMQIVEISTSLEKDLGIQWGSSSSSSSGSGSSSSSTPSLITENETIPSTNGNGKIGDFFKVGAFSRTPLEATVNAFIQEGKARLISKPRLVALSGKQASFLVGGEIPVLNTTTNATGSSSTTSTSYSQYGVNVTVTPTIREGKIDILLNVDIRDIDAANSSTASGVAFITRTASTNLFMDNKQTIALAGLIKYTDSEQLTRIPFLSAIPVVGALFRNRQTPSPDTNTEMVIILTPTVLTDKKIANSQLVMPTPAENISYQEIDSKYNHEPLPAWPAVAKTAPVVVQAPVNRSVMTSYARMVQEKISRSISYPPSSMGVAMAGTVKLKLHILKNGSLDSEVVTESSGNVVLDQDAIQAARAAAPFDAFAPGMEQQDLIFTIPIVYNRFISETPAPDNKVIASY